MDGDTERRRETKRDKERRKDIGANKLALGPRLINS